MTAPSTSAHSSTASPSSSLIDLLLLRCRHPSSPSFLLSFLIYFFSSITAPSTSTHSSIAFPPSSSSSLLSNSSPPPSRHPSFFLLLSPPLPPHLFLLLHGSPLHLRPFLHHLSSSPSVLLSSFSSSIDLLFSSSFKPSISHPPPRGPSSLYPLSPPPPSHPLPLPPLRLNPFSLLLLQAICYRVINRLPRVLPIKGTPVKPPSKL